MKLNRWLAWGIAVLAASIILTATGYIWLLSAAYGPGSDQDIRLGYTMKNAQRVPGDTPEQAGLGIAKILGGPYLNVTSDPVGLAIIAPIAATRGQTLVYGGTSNGTEDINSLIVQSLQILNQSHVIVIVSVEEPAYAMPAAYTAAQFKAPVIAIENKTLSSSIQAVLQDREGLLFIVAAPERLVPNDMLDELRRYGQVERVADEDIYRHTLLWAKGRWGNFGWGIDPRYSRDGYFYFTLTNPDDLGFAAAGLSTAFKGNYGPLLYTERDDLSDLVDQYLWRASPDFYASPADGPFMNVRVIGGPDSVSYNAQARADLALETQPYLNQKTGASGLALIGWSWFIMGLAGAIWSLFIIPRRLPDTGFYPRIYWPMAMLVLGLLGIIAFILAYEGRPVSRGDHMAKYVRPLWAKAVSATIMSLGVGMSLMIASMWVFMSLGMPLTTAFGFTPVYWIGAPMSAEMWILMVIPAIILSALFYMGPMMADMSKKGYLEGVKEAVPVVALTMISTSIGMWTTAWYLMNWQGLMARQDLWLWITPIWAASAVGFFVALIPNYLMVRAGWKHGGM